jgi:1-acyl-sn-glycerol-3-phosphate acyltransferase
MGLRLYCCSRALLRVLFRLGGGLEVRGRERVPPSGPLIIASNHASHLDPMILGTALDRPLAFMARKTLFDNAVFSWFIRAHFAFPLDREGDIREALRAFSDRLAEGNAVVLFPEGTRTRTGKLAEIKAGVGMISVKNAAPVLPAYIWGSYLAWPRSRRFPKPHRLKVLLGEPIVPAPVTSPAQRKAEQLRVADAVRASLLALEEEAWQGEPPPVPLIEPGSQDGPPDAGEAQTP